MSADKPWHHREELWNDVPVEVRGYLWICLGRYIKRHKLYCADNFRFGAKGDAASVAKYELKRAYGCCGFMDEEITVDGAVYLFGCNHGH